MSYALQVEVLERRVVAMAAAAAPYSKEAWSIPDEARDEFDRDLCAEPGTGAVLTALQRELRGA